MDFETIYLIGYNENILEADINIKDENFYFTVTHNARNIKAPQILGHVQNPNTKKLLDNNKQKQLFDI